VSHRHEKGDVMAHDATIDQRRPDGRLMTTRNAKTGDPSVSDHGSNTRNVAGSAALRLAALSIVVFALVAGLVGAGPAQPAQAWTKSVMITAESHPFKNFNVNGQITGDPGQWVAYAIHSKNLATGAWTSDSSFTTAQVGAIPSSFGGYVPFPVYVAQNRSRSVNSVIKVLIEVRWYDAASKKWSASQYFSPTPHYTFVYDMFGVKWLSYKSNTQCNI